MMNTTQSKAEGETRFSQKPTTPNVLAQVLHSPPNEEVEALLKEKEIQRRRDNTADVFWFSFTDEANNRNRSLEEALIDAFRQCPGCWVKFLRRSSDYPKTRIFRIQNLEMGSFLDHSTFITHQQIEEITLWLSGKHLELRLTGISFINFSAYEMEDFVLIDPEETQLSVYFTLKHPPRLSESHGSSSKWDDRLRVSEFELSDGTHLKINSFARCRTYCLQLDHHLLRPIIDFCESVKKDVYFCKVMISQPIRDCPASAEFTQIPGVRYQDSWAVNLAWYCVISSSGFVAERFNNEFFDKLKRWSEKIVIRGLYWLARLMNTDHFLNPCDFVHQFPQICIIGKHNQNLEDPKFNCRVPRMVLTPTRLVFFEPEIIKSNRILRSWSEKTHFLKISIRDEDFERLSRIHGDLHSILSEIFARLQQGFQFMGKNFQFLGCSNNQVRDHGCFFVDQSENANLVSDIRHGIGNLGSVKNVAKYVSRLGQAFSTSTKTVRIGTGECEKIDDIVENGYTFTDGIGMISPELAQQVTQLLERCPVVPCAFQIRFGGCKGVVAVNPEINNTHPEKKLLFRQSMLKYWSNETTVEVLASFAKPQELYLNQQLIMLLSHLGVPNQVFMDLFKAHLKSLSDMFFNEEACRNKLGSLDCGIDWISLFQTNFQTTTDPYFRSLLKSLYTTQMKGLIEKSRIPIDPLQARVLLGTVDETKTLQYGQVFIQISKNIQSPQEEKLVIEKEVVIGKSPCLHPGDVRKFLAVDCPLLHHMCDCIVFPAQGPRPHPNELSGSDLDGDLYHVVWLEKLLPRKPNKTPLVYSPVKVVDKEQPISTEDMLSFLKENIESDCLGRINNSHKALADQQGIDSWCCLELAKLHVQAVDAPKTGKWATIPAEIRKKLHRYPDFMRKEDKPCYPSEKILGMMFRECEKLISISCFSNSPSSPLSMLESCPVLEVEGMEKFLEDARKQRSQYNAALQYLMTMYGIKTEAELMSGCIEVLHKKIGKETSPVFDLIYNLRSKLVHDFREVFLEDLQEQEEVAKAAAWYHVCYHPKEDCESFKVGGKEMRFLSFAWINTHYLMKAFEQVSFHSNDMNSKITRLMEAYWIQEESQLLEAFPKHLFVNHEMNGILTMKGYEGMLYGATYTLLFDPADSETEILVRWYGNNGYYGGRPSPQQVNQTMMDLKSFLHEEEDIYTDIYQSSGIFKLQFSYYCEKLGHLVSGHFAFDPILQSQSRLLLEYIYHHPWLIIILRILIKWMKVHGFIKPLTHSLLEVHVLCFMFIDHCLSTEIIDSIDPSEFDTEKDFVQYAESGTWSEICERLRTIVIKSVVPLGRILLSFFSEGKPYQIHSQLRPVFQKHYYFQICSAEGLHLLKDEMNRAYHQLCFHGTIETLFTPSETEKVLYLSNSSIRQNGSEEFLQKWIFKTTGVKVECHYKRKEGNEILLKFIGPHMAIYQAEKQLENFQQRNLTLENLLVNLPGSLELFVQDSCRVIIEGIQRCDERVILEEYWGPQNPQDDNHGLYTITVPDPQESIPASLYDVISEKFLAFKFFFLQKWKLLTENYDRRIHGVKKLEICFGRLYVISPPRQFIEESSYGISFQTLQSHLVDSHHDNKDYITDLTSWKEKIKQKSKNDRTPSAPRKIAFFNRLPATISGASLEAMLHNYGLEQSSEKEFIVLQLRGKKHGLTGIYKRNLLLSAVKYPPIKWLNVDLKRFCQHQKEIDIHFELFTQLSYHNEMDGELHGALFTPSSSSSASFSSFNSEISVQRSLMSKVHEMSVVYSREYRYSLQHPFWSSASVVLNQLMVSSRPKVQDCDKFGMQEDFFEMKLCFDLEKLVGATNSQLPNDFIEQLWFQTLCFSDILYEHYAS